MASLFKGQPKAFYLIFMLEFWERFGYYTVQGIFAYFFVKSLGFSSTEAFYTLGAFSALVYGMVSFGGLIGDKLLGTKRTIVLGIIILALGYLALALSTKSTVYFALGLVCVGNGLFKANPSNLLAKSYAEGDKRLHGAFTLYYMAINIGSIFALILGPTISMHFGWHSAFFLSFLGLLAAFINYLFYKKAIQTVQYGPDTTPLKYTSLCFVLIGCLLATVISAYLLKHVVLTQWLLALVAAAITITYFAYLKTQDNHYQKRMWVAFILMLEAIVFFTLYQQMPTSLNFFAIHNVTPELLGIRFDPQSFQVLNPLWIMLASPLLAKWYMVLHKRNANFSVAHKFALGMTCCATSFTLLFFTRYFGDENGIVSPYWLVASYGFQSVGELLVSALGIAMIAELVPPSITGFIMGMWFLTSSIAGFTGAYVASLTEPPKGITPGIETLNIYSHVFLEIGLVTFSLAILMWFFAKPLAKIIADNPLR